jgi:dihydrofolate reductase
MVSIVVARSRNLVIGREGGLPWHLPSDLRRFRELTTGKAVIMGRKTFESLPDAYRPLPNRRNMVLSSDPDYAPEGAEAFDGLEAALEACGGEGLVIGGSRVYSTALPFADRVYLTHVEGDYEGDAFFPDLPAQDWRCVETSDPVVENDCEFTFQVYDRAA